mmetsp:Transcript_131863/g.422164  ORF Transcript_131863/g.422164 Transcript_131863/m.422164 type:complete len:264 (-) Transcript_131863:249-1040(-)
MGTPPLHGAHACSRVKVLRARAFDLASAREPNLRIYTINPDIYVLVPWRLQDVPTKTDQQIVAFRRHAANTMEGREPRLKSIAEHVEPAWRASCRVYPSASRIGGSPCSPFAAGAGGSASTGGATASGMASAWRGESGGACGANAEAASEEGEQAPGRNGAAPPAASASWATTVATTEGPPAIGGASGTPAGHMPPPASPPGAGDADGMGAAAGVGAGSGALGAGIGDIPGRLPGSTGPGGIGGIGGIGPPPDIAAVPPAAAS